jgi:hypothetical protein
MRDREEGRERGERDYLRVYASQASALREIEGGRGEREKKDLRGDEDVYASQASALRVVVSPNQIHLARPLGTVMLVGDK